MSDADNLHSGGESPEPSELDPKLPFLGALERSLVQEGEDLGLFAEADPEGPDRADQTRPQEDP